MASGISATTTNVSALQVPTTPRAINRTVLILFICQALAVTNPIVQTAVGGLIGLALARISHSDARNASTWSQDASAVRGGSETT